MKILLRTVVSSLFTIHLGKASNTGRLLASFRYRFMREQSRRQERLLAFFHIFHH